METDENRKLSAQIENIVIAGAGQAGGRAAEALRAKGFQGAITMLGEEPHPPYERPQLSKEMLHAPDMPVTYIKQAGDWHDKLGVRLETNAAVTELRRRSPDRVDRGRPLVRFRPLADRDRHATSPLRGARELRA